MGESSPLDTCLDGSGETFMLPTTQRLDLIIEYALYLVSKEMKCAPVARDSVTPQLLTYISAASLHHHLFSVGPRKALNGSPGLLIIPKGFMV